MKPVIISLGAMYVDIHGVDFPFSNNLAQDKEIVGKDYELVPGGSALGFARLCTHLGLPTAFIGKAGKDEMGDLLEVLVKKAGIIPAFVRADNLATNIAMNFSNSQGKSVMTVVGSANQTLSKKDMEDKLHTYAKDALYLYLGGCFKLKTLLYELYDILQSVKKYKVKIILDHGRVTNAVTKEDILEMQKIITLVDYYLPSKDEFLAVWGANTIEEGLQNIEQKTTATTIVKNAEKGATSIINGNINTIPAFPVNVINPVAAGDTFNAGFIKAQYKGLSLQDSIRYGNAYAAIKISTLGLPDIEKASKLVDSIK